MSSCYIFANVKVTDPVQYEEYRKWSSLAMKTTAPKCACAEVR